MTEGEIDSLYRERGVDGFVTALVDDRLSFAECYAAMDRAYARRSRPMTLIIVTAVWVAVAVPLLFLISCSLSQHHRFMDGFGPVENGWVWDEGPTTRGAE